MIRDAEHSSRMERYLYLVESKTMAGKAMKGLGINYLSGPMVSDVKFKIIQDLTYQSSVYINYDILFPEKVASYQAMTFDPKKRISYILTMRILVLRGKMHMCFLHIQMSLIQ